MQNLLRNLLFIFAFVPHAPAFKLDFIEGQKTILPKNIIQLLLPNHFAQGGWWQVLFLVERNRRRNMRKEDGDEEKVKEEEEGVGGR